MVEKGGKQQSHEIMNARHPSTVLESLCNSLLSSAMILLQPTTLDPSESLMM